MHNYSQVSQYDMCYSSCHDEVCHDITIKISICALEIIIICDTATESMIENSHPYILTLYQPKLHICNF